MIQNQNASKGWKAFIKPVHLKFYFNGLWSMWLAKMSCFCLGIRKIDIEEIGILVAGSLPNS